MEVHSIYFMTSDGWGTASARSWLKRHGYKAIKRVDKVGRELRYRILPPELFRRFVTKILPGPGQVHIVFGIR